MNAAEKLAREISRVSILLGMYRGMANMPNVCVGPVIAMIERALEEAFAAAGSNDAELVIASLQELGEFNE
jgi:hypothetical protein